MSSARSPARRSSSCARSAAKATGRTASRACAPTRCARGSLFACLPGELQWDATLAARGTVAPADARALWRYCAEGGVENARLALALCGASDRPRGAAALPRAPMPAAGFWPAEPASRRRPDRRGPVLSRAGGGRRDRADRGAVRRRCGRAASRPVPIFVTSLKDERSAAFVQRGARRRIRPT